MKPPRFNFPVFRALRGCGWLFVAMTGAGLAEDDAGAKRELPADRIAAVIAAHDDPLPGMKAEAERWWDRIVAGKRALPDIPLPAWMADALQRRPPRKWPGDDDYGAWAAFLSRPDFAEPMTALQHLASPAARAWAPAVIPWLSSRDSWYSPRDNSYHDADDVAMVTLQSMGGPNAAAARGLTDVLKKKKSLSAAEIALLYQFDPRECPALLKELIPYDSTTDAQKICESVEKLHDPRLAEALVPYLKSENTFSRLCALTALRKLGAPQALPAALDALTLDDNVFAAMEIVGEMGDNRLRPLVAEYLDSVNEQDQAAAAHAAARAGMFSMAPRMGKILRRTEDPNLRAKLFESLALLQAREFIPLIAERLSIEYTAEAALAALTRLDATAAVPQITALRDRTKKPAIQTACIHTLLALHAMTRGEAVRALTALLDRNPDGDRRIDDEKIIAELVRLDAVESAPSILRAAGSIDYPQHYWDPLNDLRVSAQTALLAEILASGDATMQLGCLKYLHDLRYLHVGSIAECSPYIVRLLNSDAPSAVRDHAIKALAIAGDPDAFRALAEFLLREELYYLKSTALDTLKSACYPPRRLPAEAAESLRLFVSRSKAGDPLQCDAIELLGASAPGPDTDAFLLSLLRQQPEAPSFLRKAIARSFSPAAPPEAAAALAEMLKDKDGEVRRAALDGLKHLKAEKDFTGELVALIQKGEWSPQWFVQLREFGDRRIPDAMGLPYLSQARSDEEAERMLPYLSDPHALDNFAGIEGFSMTRHLHRFIEVALKSDRRAAVMFAARMVYAETPELILAWQWLGHRQASERPALPADGAKAKEIVQALHRVRGEAIGHKEYPLTVRETSQLMAEVITAASWSWRDAEWLETMAAELQRDARPAEDAAGVLALAQTARDEHPLQRALRAAAALPVLWLLILLLYPWSRLAQAMVWNRWTRRWLGLGCVGPLVLAMPRLRQRTWRPFREALVPPGEVVSFDEWTFFDAVRVTPEGGGDTQPALRVLSGCRGVTVLRGESGLGKTTLLQALTAQASQPVALLRAAECGQGLLSALRARLPQHAQRDPAFLRALVQRQSPDIFVDAVHEAPPAVRAKLTDEINTLPGANILLTTQPLEWTPPQNAAQWQLEPLRPQDIAPFLLKQGTAAVEAADTGSLAERQRAFASRAAAFLNHFETLPPESAAAAALRRMLGNPMETVLAAELLAAGQTPDPNRLLEQRMEHLAEDFTAHCGGEFPAVAFAEHLHSWRASGAPLLPLERFHGVASFLAKHRLLRKSADSIDAWRFRHDKVMEWFLRPGAA